MEQLEKSEYDYDSFREQGTGGRGEGYDYQIVSYPFDRYEIKVKLSPSNQFIGITEVKLNKSFLSHSQRIGTQNYLDVDKYYRE